ncbi:aldehyde dehydrogenase family protein [Cupriavidus sp. CuC1]|uniref:aldehyde dehydrogenase family protein n=1 Tax=Cupriavidus sp. CuC1 TaxID=3373131 RepID=UPI0037D5B809
MFSSIDPCTGELIDEFVELSDRQLDAKLDLSIGAQLAWSGVSIDERAKVLKAAEKILTEGKDRLALLMTSEMGKTLKSARAEVEKCAWVCQYYAENGANFLRDEAIETGASASYVRYLPLGALLAVMPWNFPFWQVFRFLAPAMIAGNTIVLKHSSNVPQCALAIEDVLLAAGAPAGAFQTLLIGSKRVAGVIADSRIAAVTMTGSEGAGRKVAEAAGAHIKKCVLELGSNDPFIVMPSADLDKAVPAAIQARIMNNGQSCVAAKRFLVHDAIYDEFEERFVEGLRALKVGDPRSDETDIGPLATLQTREDVERQVSESIRQGATLLCGGKRIGTRGFFYSPAAVSNVPPNAPMYSEEVFAP